jgi:hypothetical protein
MSNLYEIHVSVELKDGPEEVRWIWFCKDHHFHNIRVLNQKGKHNVQNMISKWCHRGTDAEAAEYARAIAQDIKNQGFTVVRTKAEAMLMNRGFDTVELKGEAGVYWEFHFKVLVGSYDDYLKLENIVDPLEHVSVSQSAYSKTGFPIVTIRLHEGTRDEAILTKDRVIGVIKGGEFHIHDKMQAECSVFDTNPGLDEGWIE